MNHSTIRDVKFQFDGKVHKVSIKQTEDGFQVKVDQGEWKNVTATASKFDGRFTLRINIEGALTEFSAVISPETIAVFGEGGKTELEIVKPAFLNAAEISGDSNKSSVVSPMPGVLDKLLVKTGDQVKAGDPLAVIIGDYS